MAKFSRTIQPDQSRADIYDRKYHLYVQAIEYLDGLWEETQKLVAWKPEV